MKFFLIRKFGDLEYKVFLPLLYLTIFILLSISIYGLYINDWSLEQKPYMVCNSNDKCFNTLFNSPSCEFDETIKGTPICTWEYLPSGFSYGEKPSFIVKNLNSLVFGIIALFIFLNTFIWNKTFLRDFKVKL